MQLLFILGASLIKLPLYFSSTSLFGQLRFQSGVVCCQNESASANIKHWIIEKAANTSPLSERAILQARENIHSMHNSSRQVDSANFMGASLLERDKASDITGVKEKWEEEKGEKKSSRTPPHFNIGVSLIENWCLFNWTFNWYVFYDVPVMEECEASLDDFKRKFGQIHKFEQLNPLKWQKVHFYVICRTSGSTHLRCFMTTTCYFQTLLTVLFNFSKSHLFSQKTFIFCLGDYYCCSVSLNCI